MNKSDNVLAPSTLQHKKTSEHVSDTVSNKNTMLFVNHYRSNIMHIFMTSYKISRSDRTILINFTLVRLHLSCLK